MGRMHGRRPEYLLLVTVSVNRSKMSPEDGIAGRPDPKALSTAERRRPH